MKIESNIHYSSDQGGFKHTKLTIYQSEVITSFNTETMPHPSCHLKLSNLKQTISSTSNISEVVHQLLPTCEKGVLNDCTSCVLFFRRAGLWKWMFMLDYLPGVPMSLHSPQATLSTAGPVSPPPTFAATPVPHFLKSDHILTLLKNLLVGFLLGWKDKDQGTGTTK